MKIPYIFTIFLTFLLVSCSAPSIEIPEGGLKIELNQRSNMFLPGSNEKILIEIDDIAAARTNVSITEGTSVLLYQPMREGGSWDFEASSGSYTITCTSVENKVIGKDKASFLITLVD